LLAELDKLKIAGAKQIKTIQQQKIEVLAAMLSMLQLISDFRKKNSERL